jgi:hypothetical protein
MRDEGHGWPMRARGRGPTSRSWSKRSSGTSGDGTP